MTCVAVRDGVMAADSKACGNFVTATVKLYKVGKQLVGFAGTLEQALVFIDWLSDPKQRKPDLASEQDWCALVLSDRGLEEWGASLRPMQVYDNFYAIGSGAALAMGAMEAGASAKKAVEIACKRDPYCGLPVLWKRYR